MTVLVSVRGGRPADGAVERVNAAVERLSKETAGAGEFAERWRDALVEARVGELVEKHGAKKLADVLEACEDGLKHNWLLPLRVIERIDEWIAAFDVDPKPGFKRVSTEDLTRAFKWGNQVLLVNRNENVLVCQDFVQDSFDPGVLPLNEWQWCQMRDLLLLLKEDPLSAMTFINTVKTYANEKIGWSGLVELALRMDVYSAVNLECDEAIEWIRKELERLHSAIVHVNEVEGLAPFARFMSGKQLMLEVRGGEGFATDRQKVYVPDHVGIFPTKKQNTRSYWVSTLHEAGHHAEGSFELEIDRVNLSEIGFVKVEDEKKVLVKGKVRGEQEEFETKDAFDLYDCFSNPAVAGWLHNVLEDSRVDARNIAKWTGYADDYKADNLELLAFRPNFTGEATDVFEAFLQHIVCGKVREAIPKNVEEAVRKAIELGEKAKAPGMDATQTFNIMIQVYKLLEKYIPPPVFKQLKEGDLPQGARPNKNNPHNVRVTQKPKPKKPREGEGTTRINPDRDSQESHEQLEGRNTYHEWDYTKGCYVPHAARVVEEELPAGEKTAVPLTLAAKVKRIFEVMRRREFELRRLQEDGAIDFERLEENEGLAEATGQIPESDHFMKLKVNRRQVVVITHVDASGSHTEEVNGVRAIDINKQSAAVIQQATGIMGDKSAAFAFSSSGPAHTHFHTIKPLEGTMRGVKLEPNNANRNGASLRHLKAKINAWRKSGGIAPNATVVVFDIGDLKPNDDGTGYTDKYGVEDTAKAVAELRKEGVIVIGVVVRKEPCEEAERVYGNGKYIWLQDVSQQPEKLMKIYHALAQE